MNRGKSKPAHELQLMSGQNGNDSQASFISTSILLFNYGFCNQKNVFQETVLIGHHQIGGW